MFISKQILHQTLAIFPVNLDMFSMGLAYGWVSPILNQLRSPGSDFHMSDEQCSWIASLHNVGRAFGPLIAGLLVDVVGRKRLLVSCSLALFAVWPVVLLTRAVWTLYAVRTLVGLAIGVHDSISFIYIAENSSAQLRATFGSIAIAFFYAGELVAFVLAAYCSYDRVAAIHTATTMAFLAFAFLLREPVQFLLMRGRYKAAERNFYWLNERCEQSKARFEEIVGYVRREHEKVTWRQLVSSKANYLSLKVILVLSFLEMFTGFEAITSFASMAFSSSASLSQYEFTILFGFFQFISVCLSSFIIDRFSRRTLFLLSFAASTLVHAATAALYFVHQSVAHLPHFPWLVFATITLYAVIYSVGVMPIYFTLKGEIFPQSIKGVGNSLAVVINAIVGFVTVKIFLWVASHWGMHCNFLLFSAVSSVTCVYIYVWVPETKGKTLVEIQKALES